MLNTITITVSNEDTLFDLAYTAYKHKLHNEKQSVMSGLLKYILAMIIHNYRFCKRKYRWIYKGQKHVRPKVIIAIAYSEEDKPVACLIIKGFESNVFVQKPFRRQGIATALFKEAGKKYDLRTQVINYGNHPGIKKIKQSLNIGNRIKHVRNQTKIEHLSSV